MSGTVSLDRIEELLRPYLQGAEVPVGMFGQISRYLELLTKWNARTNLTAVRDPEEVLRRHFGEGLFAARHLTPERDQFKTVLDFGSGAGFPGLPVQLLRPELQVTLAESQNKKATFLREAVRKLGLSSEVWAGRVEAMPPGRQFDVVILRAVDDMETALVTAATRASARLVVLSTDQQQWMLPDGFELESTLEMIGSGSRHMLSMKRVSAGAGE